MLKNTTRNINLYLTNHKFNNNLFVLNYDNYKFVEISANTSIHKYVFTNPSVSKNSIFMFNMSIINNEILSFIEAFYTKLSIVLFVDKQTEAYDVFDMKYTEIPQIVTQTSMINRSNKTLLPTHIVNEHLYDTDPSSINKENQYIYFLRDDILDINPNLAKLLYPNTDLRIKMFNNINIKHHQNIGYATELNKKDILYNSKYYLFDNHDYLAEAVVAGCHCIDLNHDVEDQVIRETINRDNILKQTTSYKQILEDVFV